MYKIIKIANKDGTERTEPIYFKRTGCIGDVFHLQVGNCLIFTYLYDKDGNIKTGYLRTSIVEAIGECNGDIVVYTANSIYTLRKI